METTTTCTPYVRMMSWRWTATLARIDGRALCTTSNPTRALTEAHARNTLQDTFSASAALAGDALYLRGKSTLYCLAEAKP